MDKKYSNKGLKIIAAEVQGSSKQAIGKIIEENNAGFTVTKGAQGPVSIAGIPHAVAFGADGKLIFKGHPASDEFKDVVKKALRDVKVVEENPGVLAALGDVIEQRTWTNSEGVKMIAAVTKIDGDKVIFRLQKNGKTVPYPISKLSEEDQKLIKEKIEDE
ncbi:MAG: hypothetical protein P8P32_07800 [Akkermansiaceae bacterium]|nr:hypothetical protein [Akkermansiaceae bacterium]